MFQSTHRRDSRRPNSRHPVRRFGSLLATVAFLASVAAGPTDAAFGPAATFFGKVSPGTGRPLIAPGLVAEIAAGEVSLADLAPKAKPVAVRPAPKPAVKPTAKPAAPPKSAPKTTTKQSTTTVYRGTNHVWSTALWLNRTVYWFPCSRSTYPGYVVYRWGCAGANNVYLFAHAGGPFKHLHDLYVTGRLRKGMVVVYADGGGHVHRYAIAWWRVTSPTNGAFAYASLSRPSMTLQTCVGANDRYRLIVRLYQTN